MRNKTLPALQELLSVVLDIDNKYLQAARKQGKKIVGIIVSETPEELLTAAGCVPVMLRGTNAEGVEYAEAYFRQLTCDYTRCTFNQVLEGKWDFLDGAVIFNNCDHMRRIFDNWQLLPNNPAYHFLYVPKGKGALANRYYREQLKKLIAATEKKFGVKITDDELKRAIKLHNETRILQQQIYEMQKGKAVYLTGAELIQVMLAGVCMPKEDYNRLLKELIAQLKEANETFTPSRRLLYTGGHVDNAQFFELLDGHGAQVVADDLPFGTRSCEVLIAETDNPFEAIADFYFDRKPAPTRQFGTQRDRMKRLKKLVDEYSLDGVIMSRVVMCDIWSIEQYMARDYLTSQNIPLLELEVNYMPAGQGQIATRVQAFVESLNARQ